MTAKVLVTQPEYPSVLQRHIPIQLGISGPIYLAHAAFADLGGYGIGARVVPGSRGMARGRKSAVRVLTSLLSPSPS